MATSGEDERVSIVDTYCTRDVTLLSQDLICNWAGEVDLRTFSDGHAEWTCPYCVFVHESHTSDWEPTE